MLDPDAMSATIFSLDIDVSGPELGPGSVAHTSHLFRYFERARWRLFDWSAEGGDNTMTGVVRAQTAQIEAELRYGDRLVLQTWLARVGRTSFDFGHRLERVDGQLITTSRCTVVRIGPTGPIPVDPSLAERVHEAPAPAHVAHGGVAGAGSYAQDVVVRPSDTDSFGHVNQARYIDLVDDARKLAALSGHPAGAEGRVAFASIEYIRETLARDVVTARIGLAEDGARHVALSRGDEQLTRAVLRFA